jgi:prephenate dehydratase
LKIGIQGIKASFHDVAAKKYFANHEISPVECLTFKNLCTTLQNKDSKYALMAIENSIAGSILTNYSLLETYNFKIIGEVFLRIKMNLMALPGQKLEDIRIIQSHPMALLQCQEFLTDHPQMPKMKILESSDTAESAKVIFEKQLLSNAAIASELAAETYHLEILRHGIETNRQNYTRFLVISNRETPSFFTTEDILPNKTSLCFEVDHRPGSLAYILNIFSQHNVNMTKIQSVPILGKPYQYSFHIDLEWVDYELFQTAIAIVNTKVSRLVSFGEYRSGERSTEQT